MLRNTKKQASKPHETKVTKSKMMQNDVKCNYITDISFKVIKNGIISKLLQAFTMTKTWLCQVCGKMTTYQYYTYHRWHHWMCKEWHLLPNGLPCVTHVCSFICPLLHCLLSGSLWSAIVAILSLDIPHNACPFCDTTKKMHSYSMPSLIMVTLHIPICDMHAFLQACKTISLFMGSFNSFILVF